MKLIKHPNVVQLYEVIIMSCGVRIHVTEVGNLLISLQNRTVFCR